LNVLKQMTILRRPFYLLILLAVAISPALAQTCAESITPLLEDAKTSIGANDSEKALSLIDQATALLSTCTATTDASDAAPAATSEAGTMDITGLPLDADSSIAFIAFAHASVDAGPVDLYSADSDQPIVTDLAFGESTELTPVVAGPHTFIARPAGSDQNAEALFTTNSDLAANTTSIVTLVGQQENLSLLAEPVTLVRSDYDGKARVRVVNLSPGATVDVTSSDGNDFGTGLGWIGIQDLMVDGGAYTLQVNSGGNALTEPTDFDFPAETTTLLYVIGEPGGQTPVQFLPIVAPQDVTRVRFVNTGSQAVDIFSTDEAVVEGLAAGETSDWIPLGSTAVTFVAFAPGTGPTGTQLSGLPVQLYPGRDLTVTVGSDTMTVTDTGLSPQN
jgi:hypothetical protein